MDFPHALLNVFVTTAHCALHVVGIPAGQSYAPRRFRLQLSDMLRTYVFKVARQTARQAVAAHFALSAPVLLRHAIMRTDEVRQHSCDACTIAASTDATVQAVASPPPAWWSPGE